MVHSLVRVTYTGSGGSKEDERSEVSSALVAQGASGVDESTDTVGLESRASEGRTPGESSTGSLLGADELLLGVGGLSALVGLAEDGGEDGELNTVVESSAQGDSGGLDGGEVVQRHVGWLFCGGCGCGWRREKLECEIASIDICMGEDEAGLVQLASFPVFVLCSSSQISISAPIFHFPPSHH